MRVLHVYKTYLPENFTGVAKVIHEIAEPLSFKGVHSDVLVTGEQESGEPIKIGHHYVHVAKRDLHIASTSFSLSIFAMYRKLSQSADVIHYHFPWPMMDVLDLTIRPDKPIVVTYHSDIVKQQRILPFYKPLMHAFLSRASSIVATSQNYLESSPTLERFKNKVEVIPLGLSERKPVETERVDMWRSRLGEGFFLFVGANRYYKGLGFLLEAARKTNFPVVIAGFGFSDYEVQENIPPNVKVVGSVSEEDKEALLDLCGTFVFPSHLRSEAFGLALLEAARAGKPMISCEIGTGTSYINRDGETGFVITPANSEALAEAMTKIYANHDLQRNFGAAARRRYESHFHNSLSEAKYLKLYERLAKR
ncbi:glycosyltransferase [Rhizobium sp. L1K21]|uniref:glycosyltransferase n=1 Tax=Rhizobium sp. L1K21 TaxID=2954933 RepID=UPI0020932C7D|nr:glycosyltransferase [Rhizobium sp. L1K21]MCO6187956.1 glycosyltransferase [Rhizobium sp. L1K21]